MDSNTNVDLPKGDSGRVPSPSSVSSVHSIRPLEWDSGADIGYQYKLQSGLSTVERIALVSGTVNLLESHTSQENISRSYSRKYHLGCPLAQSSPAVTGREQLSERCSPTIRKENTNCTKPLVDYSISSEYSYEDEADPAESRSASKANVDSCDRSKSCTDSNLCAVENSKSLDDLRLINRLRRKGKFSCRSHSSQNIFDSLRKNSSNKNSSSSIATIVPHTERNPSVIDQPVRRYSSKGIQVDEVCLEFRENQRPRAAPMSSLEFFRKMYSDDANANALQSGTYSIKDDDRYPQHSDQKKGSISDDCRSTESLDGGSFEYVPGSVYDRRKIDSEGTSKTTSKDSSSVNTLCSEVVDGVELVTRYVENLRVSNKRQVIEKVAKSLIKSSIGISKEGSAQPRAASNLLLDSSPELRSKTPPYKRLGGSEPSTGSEFRSSNLENGFGASKCA